MQLGPCLSHLETQGRGCMEAVWDRVDYEGSPSQSLLLPPLLSSCHTLGKKQPVSFRPTFQVLEPKLFLVLSCSSKNKLGVLSQETPKEPVTPFLQVAAAHLGAPHHLLAAP